MFFTINLFTKLHVKVNYLIKQVIFSLVGKYLRPSNNYIQIIFNINVVVLILIICLDLRNW